jgi:hypothetical protein
MFSNFLLGHMRSRGHNDIMPMIMGSPPAALDVEEPSPPVSIAAAPATAPPPARLDEVEPSVPLHGNKSLSFDTLVRAHGLELRGNLLICTLCAVGGMQLGPRSDGRTVNWACAHINSDAPVTKVQAARGQRLLAQLCFFSNNEPQQPELCWGYHERTIQYGTDVYDTALIIQHELHNTHFYTEPHTQHEYRRSSATFIVCGLIRSRSCTRYALQHSGRGPRIHSCAYCLALPKVNSFRMLVTNKRYLVGDPRAEPLLPDKRTN